jgi:hypothetical protein
MTRRMACLCWTCFVVVLFQGVNAQGVSQSPCTQVDAIARILRSDSLAALTKAKQNAGSTYRAEIVFAARSLELQPNDKSAAVRLLNLLPQDDTQHVTLMTLGDSLCDEESVAEMTSLSRIGERLSRDFAKAILLAPDMLPRYIAYASTSVGDPHSDYAVQMQPVCRARHSEFVKAVVGLPTEQRFWLVKHVFNPEKCRALALPELSDRGKKVSGKKVSSMISKSQGK